MEEGRLRLPSGSFGSTSGARPLPLDAAPGTGVPRACGGWGRGLAPPVATGGLGRLSLRSLPPLTRGRSSGWTPAAGFAAA